MSATMNPSTILTLPSSFQVPTAGDPMRTVTGASPIDPIFQGLLDGIESLRVLSLGGGIRRAVLSYDGNNVAVYPLGAVITLIAATWTTVAHNATSVVNLSSGLAANTRYWVYVANIAGTPTFSASTTAPDDGLHYMTADQSKMYVSTFVTDGAKRIVPYTQTGSAFQYYEYTATGSGVSGNLLLDSGTHDGGLSAVNLAPAVPAGASSYSLQYVMSGTSGHQGKVFVDNNASRGALFNLGIAATAQGQVSGSAFAGNFLYGVQDHTSDSMSVWASGFTL